MTSFSNRQLFFNFNDVSSLQNATNADIFVSPHNEKIFNFLFNYKGSWLSPFILIIGDQYSGKTLLLTSFCNQCESCLFVNIEAMKNIDENYQIYIIDDLQNIKKEYEEDFFHFLNFIIVNKKQLVISSSKTIDEINFATKDVYSRIRSSLVFYITKPKESIMKFIFTRMCYNLGFDVSKQIVDYIFKNTNTDFINLGEFANKLYNTKMTVNKKITFALVKQIIA